MATSRLPLLRQDIAEEARQGFAGRALDFAKRVSRRLTRPGVTLTMLAATAAITLLLIVSGAFGTGPMPFPVRTGFWSLLMGWNLLKWRLWFAATVRRPEDWFRFSLIGMLVLNVSLPLEIDVALAIWGFGPTDRQPILIWAEAAMISLGALAVISIALVQRRPGSKHAESTAPGEELAALLKAAGQQEPETLMLVEAEDHYCRLHFTGGGSKLIHRRFSDVLGAVSDLDGAQIHRGRWVAAHAVRSSLREGRRWQILLADGSRVPLSASYVGVARTKGWLPPR